MSQQPSQQPEEEPNIEQTGGAYYVDISFLNGMNVNPERGSGSEKRPLSTHSMSVDGVGSSSRKKGRHNVVHDIYESIENHLAWKRDADERKATQQTPATEPYDEGVVIVELQNLMKSYNIDRVKFPLAVKEFKELSVRKMFVHMEEDFKVAWICSLGD